MRQHSTPESSILSWTTFGIADFLSVVKRPQPLTANNKVLVDKPLWHIITKAKTVNVREKYDNPTRIHRLHQANQNISFFIG